MTEEEVAEMPEEMERVYSSLKLMSALKTKWDDILPWRNGKETWNHGEIKDLWEWAWENPEEFSESGFPDDIDVPEEYAFCMGVVFGIEYERAYPTDQGEDWPVPLDER